jgi:hypothetical protein
MRTHRWLDCCAIYNNIEWESVLAGIPSFVVAVLLLRCPFLLFHHIRSCEYSLCKITNACVRGLCKVSPPRLAMHMPLTSYAGRSEERGKGKGRERERWRPSGGSYFLAPLRSVRYAEEDQSASGWAADLI